MAEGYEASDRAADEAARDRDISKKAVEDHEKKRLAGALLKLLPARDRVVLEWVCNVTGKSPGQVALEMIRQSIIKERRAYREAHGGGGASSTNPEALAERLPRR